MQRNCFNLPDIKQDFANKSEKLLSDDQHQNSDYVIDNNNYDSQSSTGALDSDYLSTISEDDIIESAPSMDMEPIDPVDKECSPTKQRIDYSAYMH